MVGRNIVSEAERVAQRFRTTSLPLLPRASRQEDQRITLTHVVAKPTATLLSPACLYGVQTTSGMGPMSVKVRETSTFDRRE